MKTFKRLLLIAILLVALALLPETAWAKPVASFGDHVSGMAPDHAIDHGRIFGQCVSSMVVSGECPHHSG